MIGLIANSQFGLTFGFYKKYPTTAEAVMRVSGMHFEEICSIAQKRGIEVIDIKSRCIDEKLLSCLAKAFARKIQVYFETKQKSSDDIVDNILLYSVFYDLFFTYGILDLEKICKLFIQTVKNSVYHISLDIELNWLIWKRKENTSQWQKSIDSQCYITHKKAIADYLTRCILSYYREDTYKAHHRNTRKSIELRLINAGYNIYSDEYDC